MRICGLHVPRLVRERRLQWRRDRDADAALRRGRDAWARARLRWTSEESRDRPRLHGRAHMSYERILYEQRGEIALITLNRPEKLNAWTPQMSVEQVDAIERANADRSIGAIIMTGAGRGFC